MVASEQLRGKVPPEVIARYHLLVHEKLQRLGWDVVDADNLNAIASAAVCQPSGFYNPLTGAQDPVKVAIAEWDGAEQDARDRHAVRLQGSNPFNDELATGLAVLAARFERV